MTAAGGGRDGPRWTTSLAVLAPLAVVAAGVVATLVVVGYEERVRAQELRERADLVGDVVSDEVAALLETQIGGAAATAAALSVDPDLDRAAFGRYATGIADQLPTLLGVGYIRRVATDELDDLEAAARADNAPDFRLQDLSSGAEHAILLYNEPASELRGSWGVDVSSVPEAGLALQQATDDGRTAVTERVVLAVDRDVPEAERPVGYVAYAPVFQPGATTATVQERRDAVVGWSNLPFRAQELLDLVQPPAGVQVTLRDDEAAVATIGPDVGAGAATSVHALRSPNAPIRWAVETSVPASAVQSAIDRSTAALVVGAGLTAVLAVLVGLVARGSRRWAFTAGRALRTLRRSEERLRATVDAAPDLLLVVERDGTVSSTSPRAEELLGADPEEVDGQPIDAILPGVTDVASIEDRAEHRIRRRDGSRITVEAAARPLRPGDPSSEYVVAIRDVTAQRQARRQLRARSRQLERSNRDLAVIATIAAHDLSEPLAVIGGYADLLVQRYPTSSTVDDVAVSHLRTIAGAAHRMRGMLDALLHMSGLGSDGPAPSTVSLDDVVRDALANTESALSAIGAETVVGPMPTVWGRRDLLVELVQNLLANAARHGRSDRRLRITVDAEREPTAWRITVADNGEGVPAPQRKRIFETFRRLDSTASGLGIGLSVAHRIVELHGGRIEVRDAPGGGAAFTFTLPDRKPAPRPADAEAN